MGNFANDIWQNVNAGNINSILANSAAVSQRAGEAKGNPEDRATVEITAEYPYEEEIVSSSLWWDTPKISHILKFVADQVFDDVESAYVDFNQQLNKVIGTLYFEYNASPKSETGLLAFKSLANGKVPNNVVDQVIQTMAQQNNGEAMITKEGMDILSDWIYLPQGINRTDPKWPMKIDWKNYVDFIPSASKAGCSIRLSGIDITRIISMIIKSKKVSTPEGTVSKKLDIVVKPGQMKAGTIDRLYEIIIYDAQRAQEIVGAVTGSAAPFNTGNKYISYV